MQIKKDISLLFRTAAYMYTREELSHVFRREWNFTRYSVGEATDNAPIMTTFSQNGL